MTDLSAIISDTPTGVANPSIVMSEQQQSAFFDKIPLELRLKIYKYALDDVYLCLNWRWWEGAEQKSGCHITGLECLRACQKTFNEAIPYASSIPLVADSVCTFACGEFFLRFPLKLRHRLERVTLFLPELWGGFGTEEINQNQYPNLRVIELRIGSCCPSLPMDHPAYYRHATCLIKREDGPSDYIDDRFTQDVWSTHGYPGLKEFLQTSGIVIQMRVGLRVVAWEKLAGWPYSDIFCRIYDAEYPNVALAWDKDNVALLNCPDLRKEFWHRDWVKSTCPEGHCPCGIDHRIHTRRFFMNMASSQGEVIDIKEMCQTHLYQLYGIDGDQFSETSDDTSIARMLLTGELGASEN